MPASDDKAVEALAERVFTSGVASLELINIYLGQQLGLYRALSERRMTAGELAAAAQIDRRYAEEWLQSQALSGFVVIDGEDRSTGVFGLAPGAYEVFVDEESPSYLGAMGQVVVASARVMPELLAAFQTGEGVPYPAYGPDAVHAQAAFNRPAFTHDLTSSWIPAMPSVAAKLADISTPRRIADIGCGVGWSSIALAKAYPQAHIDGIDIDEMSIEEARANARAQGLDERINFEVRDISDMPEPGIYDVAFFFECLHDMSDPDGALRHTRAALKPDGEVVVMDERTDDRLIAPSDDPLQRFLGAVSVAWCLPQGRVGDGAHPVGTVIRTADVQRLAQAAGFESMAVLPVEHPMFRFYQLAQ